MTPVVKRNRISSSSEAIKFGSYSYPKAEENREKHGKEKNEQEQ